MWSQREVKVWYIWRPDSSIYRHEKRKRTILHNTMWKFEITYLHPLRQDIVLMHVWVNKRHWLRMSCFHDGSITFVPDPVGWLCCLWTHSQSTVTSVTASESPAHSLDFLQDQKGSSLLNLPDCSHSGPVLSGGTGWTSVLRPENHSWSLTTSSTSN